MSCTSPVLYRTDIFHLGNTATLEEFRSDVQGILHVWRDRAQMEAKVWAEFILGIERAGTLDEALFAYTAFVARRMRMTTENTQRVFEEYRRIQEAYP